MTVVLFTSAGTATWICPASVTSISIECLGGGGAGSTRTSNGGGGGGGGGAYAKINAFTVTPGTSYSYTVGSAGVVGGAGGGDSSFNSTTCVAKGGATVAADTATGGAGGLASGSTGDITRNGGSGWTASGGGGGGGSSGGIDAAGVTATSSTGAAAVVAGGAGGDGKASPQGNAPANASAYGGGGGGGYRTSSGTRTGTNGAAGYVRITYAPYSMTDFWGCAAWYDPSDASTVTLVSGVVSQITDKSGAGLTLTQGTAGNRPAMSTLNGRACFDTTNTDVSLSRATVANTSLFAANNTDVSVFVAAKHHSSAVDATLVWGTTSGNRLVLHLYYSGTNYIDLGSDTTGRVSAAAPANNSNMVLSAVRSGANINVYVNGSAFASRADASGTTSSTNTLTLFKFDALTLSPDAQTGEIVIFNRPLSTSERQTIESYLTTKWFTATSNPAFPATRRGGFSGLIVR